MTVREFIELLQKQDQNRDVGIEGCDCTAMVAGVSPDDKHPILWIRQDSGVLSWSKQNPIIK